MNTKTKLFLDHNFIRIIVKIVNLLVIPLGKILKIDHRLDKSFSTIAICKYKGMGSIIQSTPLIKTITKNYPNAKIIFITSVENRQITNLIKDIDEVLYIDDNSFFSLLISIFPLIHRLIKRKIEVFIDLEVYSNFSTLICLFSLSKNRLGFYMNSKHYRLGNYTHMMYYNTRSSIAETYLQFAGMLHCIKIDKELYHFKDVSIIDLLKFSFISDTSEYIVINPNASDLRIERQWPKNYFVQLIQLLIENHPDKQIVLIGSKNESPYVDSILNRFSKAKILSLAGKTTITELISIIKNAKIVITNDTGPMHIAFAVETPTIALFGPCSPNQYGISKNCIVVYQNLYCSPCVHEFVTPPCRGNNYCMKSIMPDNVCHLVENYFNKGIAASDGVRKDILFQYDDFTIGTVTRKIND